MSSVARTHRATAGTLSSRVPPESRDGPYPPRRFAAEAAPNPGQTAEAMSPAGCRATANPRCPAPADGCKSFGRHVLHLLFPHILCPPRQAVTACVYRVDIPGACPRGKNGAGRTVDGDGRTRDGQAPGMNRDRSGTGKPPGRAKRRQREKPESATKKLFPANPAWLREQRHVLSGGADGPCGPPAFRRFSVFNCGFRFFCRASAFFFPAATAPLPFPGRFPVKEGIRPRMTDLPSGPSAPAVRLVPSGPLAVVPGKSPPVPQRMP